MSTASLPVPAVAGLLRAISARLTPPATPLYDTEYMLALRAANSDVRLAIAAILGKDVDPRDVDVFTRLLNPEPAPVTASQCLTCGATEDLDTVHVRARLGIAARVEHYCHDATACNGRRHPHLVPALDTAAAQVTA